jgi:hypothetical protein
MARRVPPWDVDGLAGWDPARPVSPGTALAVRRLRGKILLHPLRLPLLHFLFGEIFFVRRDRPIEPVRVGEGSGAIAPELILHLPHRAAEDLPARRNGASEQRVAIIHVDPEGHR